MRRPAEEECDAYYTTYIKQVKQDDFLKALIDASRETPKFLHTLTEDQWNHRYAPGKWSIKELVLHIIDTERIFAYRALRIARNDHTPLAGFEQDDYIVPSNAASRSAASLIAEYCSVREATLTLFRNFTADMYIRMGTASEKPFTPLSIGFIIAGHEIHHLRIVKDRYLTSFS